MRRPAILTIAVVALAMSIFLFSGDRWIPWWGEGPFGNAIYREDAPSAPTWIETTSGSRLAIRETRPSTDTLAIAVLIHGLGLHGVWYADLARALADAGIVAVTVDLPGHGMSSGQRGSLPTRSALLADLEAAVGKISGRYPNLPLLLVGHSLGAELVLSPEVLNGLDQEGVAVHGIAALAPYIAGGELESPYDIHHPVLSVNIRGLVNSDWPVLRYNWPQDFDDPLLQGTFDLSLLDLWRGSGEAEKRLGSLTMPLLLLTGTEDRIISARRVMALAKAVNSRSVTAVGLPGADHMSILSRGGPELVAWARSVLPHRKFEGNKRESE
jgi:alpha-beta hydrolase superfamily lysophospholipase